MRGTRRPIVRKSCSGGVVVGPDGALAVVAQKDGSWSLPKGGVGDGEDPYAAALREIREETGLRRLVLVAALPPYERAHLTQTWVLKRMTLFLFRTDERELRPEDPDNPCALWLPPHAAVGRLTNPADRAFLAEVVRTHGLAPSAPGDAPH